MQLSTNGAYDKQLWSSFLEGDKEAYAEIYRIYFPILYEYGMRLCKDAELVKDCIQDLFVKLWINRGNLHAMDALKPYLYTALRGTVLNKLEQANRRIKREDKASQISSFDVYYNIEDSLVCLDEQAVRHKQVLNALNKLTSRQKECIFLRFYVGLEYTEIADMMHISVKASYKIIGRAIEVLRKYFKELVIYGLLVFLFYSFV
jgi:RNA polymerase sigma factor (sigma-70 family)